jgi:hypothetical protein
MCLRPVRTPADASSSSSDRISLVTGSPMASPPSRERPRPARSSGTCSPRA